MFSKILLSLGLLALGLACRTFHKRLIRKLGLLAFMGASFALFHAISGSLWVGVLGILLWFSLPWIELLTRVRHMDFPIEKPLRRRIPPKDEFPFLDAASDEIGSTTDFHLVDDWGYEWEDTEHFFRLFYHEASMTQAVICLTTGGAFSQAYLKLISRTKDGKVYTTWNYPFSASLKLEPEQRLHWDRSSVSFEGIQQSHLSFLQSSGVAEEVAPQDPEAFVERLHEDQRRLVDYNLSEGLLQASGKGLCRYTLRGLIFLWAQLVRDMVRLH